MVLKFFFDFTNRYSKHENQRKQFQAKKKKEADDTPQKQLPPMT